MKKTITRLALALTLIAGLLSMAGSAQAQSRYEDKSLELASSKTATVVAGDSSWVTLSWLGLTEVTDFEVRVEGSNGIEIAYPESTGDHTSPSNGSTLDRGERDYTAFRVTVPDTARGNQRVTVTMSWTAYGEARSASTTIRIPTTQYKGQDLEILTDSASPNEAGWVGVAYRGMAPSLPDFTVRVADDAGLSITYPRDAFTSLHGDSTLEDGETDVARFRIDDADEANGEVIVLETSYTRNGRTTVVEHKLVIGSASNNT